LEERGGCNYPHHIFGRNQALANQFLSYIKKPEVVSKLPQLIPYGVPRVDVMRAMATDAYRDLPTLPGNSQNALKVDDKFWVENGEELERIFGIYVQLYVSNAMTDTMLAQADGLIWRDHSFCIVSYCTENEGTPLLGQIKCRF
jgi:hypothetical protein